MRLTYSFSTTRPRDEVYALLDDLPGHERFTDHFLVDWERLSDNARGVGASVRFRAKGAGKHATGEITVVESSPERIVEHGRGGKDMSRATKGTYELRERADGGTDVTFISEVELEGLEKLQAPVMRLYLNRGNGRAMKRLRELLESGPPPGAAAGAEADPSR